MKWKERILLLAFIFVIIVLAILRKKSIDESFTYPVVYIEQQKRGLDQRTDNMTVDKVKKRSNVRSTLTARSKHDIHPWDLWQNMVRERAITHKYDKYVDRIINEMLNAKVLVADVGYKGTQLKAQLTLEGPREQYVVFKPKRYERTRILDGTPYEGYDRHTGEIAAFHLDRILEFYRSPPAAGRVFDLETEVIPVTRQRLRNTFFKDDNDNDCFYGVCMYCKKAEPACGTKSKMEGSLTLWIPPKWKIAKKRHPWQRTYSARKAHWEVDDNYCNIVKKTSPYNKGPRLLDIMDTAIFDFLIGNADRHHYEYLAPQGDNGMLLLLDNGKSFGNSHRDEISILAPIYQCCQLRLSTYRKLRSFSTESGNLTSLSVILDSKLKKDSLYPILTVPHLLAIDRRMKIIHVTLKTCFDTYGEPNVLKQ